MAWTSPMTFIPNTVLTAAQLNTHLRDNLLETGPAKSVGATTTGYFVAEGPYQIGRRIIHSNGSEEPQSTSSDAWTDLDFVYGTGTPSSVGPTVKILTGVNALVIIQCRVSKQINAPHKDTAFMAAAIYGATEREPDELYAFKTSQYKDGANAGSFAYMATDLNPGINIFRAKYKISGTSTATFDDRRILVIPL